MAHQDWPPNDPSDYNPHAEFPSQEEVFELPSTPWTYENGSVNPNLQPSNARKRASKSSRSSKATEGFVSNLPPYHPDYVEPSTSAPVDLISTGSDADGYSTASSDADEYKYSERGHLIRSGSEGYEVKPVDREEILRRYILSRGEEAERYQHYVPEPDSASVEGSERQSSENNDVPLAQTFRAHEG